MEKPRGVLPTFVNDARVVLCKSASRIRNCYEIRLCLALAAQQGRAFVLAVPKGAQIDRSLGELLAKHGGTLAAHAVAEYSVYIGAADSNGNELDGWVLGDSSAWRRFHGLAQGYELLQGLSPGNTVTHKGLAKLKLELADFVPDMTNIDDENVGDALRTLVMLAERSGGSLYVQ